jgi:hypothetical protein
LPTCDPPPRERSRSRQALRNSFRVLKHRMRTFKRRPHLLRRRGIPMKSHTAHAGGQVPVRWVTRGQWRMPPHRVWLHTYCWFVYPAYRRIVCGFQKHYHQEALNGGRRLQYSRPPKLQTQLGKCTAIDFRKTARRCTAVLGGRTCGAPECGIRDGARRRFSRTLSRVCTTCFSLLLPRRVELLDRMITPSISSFPLSSALGSVFP